LANAKKVEKGKREGKEKGAHRHEQAMPIRCAIASKKAEGRYKNVKTLRDGRPLGDGIGRKQQGYIEGSRGIDKRSWFHGKKGKPKKKKRRQGGSANAAVKGRGSKLNKGKGKGARGKAKRRRPHKQQKKGRLLRVYIWKL